MPDGMFQYKKSQFRYIFEDLGMENVVIFYSHLEKFAAIWYFSLPVNTYVIWSFWYIFPLCCTNENLATLVMSDI
jgi:hypothetical protein